SQQSVQRLEILRTALIQVYSEEGSFSVLQTEPERWLDLKSIIFAESDALFLSPLTQPAGEVDQASLQKYFREFVSSITLHDANKNLLLGVVKPEQTLSWIPIHFDNTLVGFIG